MSVFLVETYVVRAEKLSELDPALNEFLQFKETRPDLFNGLRSWKLLKQEYGGVSDMYIEMWEFDSLAAMEAIDSRLSSDDEMKRIGRKFHELVEATSFSASIWYPVAAQIASPAESCWKCGAEIPRDSRFCDKCGARLSDA